MNKYLLIGNAQDVATIIQPRRYCYYYYYYHIFSPSKTRQDKMAQLTHYDFAMEDHIRGVSKLADDEDKKYDAAMKKAGDALTKAAQGVLGEEQRAHIYAEDAARCKQRSLRYTQLGVALSDVQSSYREARSNASSSKRLAVVHKKMDTLAKLASYEDRLALVMQLKDDLEEAKVCQDAMTQTVSQDVLSGISSAGPHYLLRQLAEQKGLTESLKRQRAAAGILDQSHLMSTTPVDFGEEPAPAPAPRRAAQLLAAAPEEDAADYAPGASPSHPRSAAVMPSVPSTTPADFAQHLQRLREQVRN